MLNDELNTAKSTQEMPPDNPEKSSGCLGIFFKFGGIIFLCWLLWLFVTSWPLLSFWIFALIFGVTVLVKFKKRIFLLILCLCALIFLGVVAYDQHDHLSAKAVIDNDIEKTSGASVSDSAEQTDAKPSAPEPEKRVSENELVDMVENINKNLQQQQAKSERTQNISENTLNILLKNTSADSIKENSSIKQSGAGEINPSNNAEFIRAQNAKIEDENRFDEELLYTESVLSGLTK